MSLAEAENPGPESTLPERTGRRPLPPTALEIVADAHNRLSAAQLEHIWATEERALAVWRARQAGVKGAAIADMLGMARKNVLELERRGGEIATGRGVAHLPPPPVAPPPTVVERIVEVERIVRVEVPVERVVEVPVRQVVYLRAAPEPEPEVPATPEPAPTPAPAPVVSTLPESTRGSCLREGCPFEAAPGHRFCQRHQWQ